MHLMRNCNAIFLFEIEPNRIAEWEKMKQDDFK